MKNLLIILSIFLTCCSSIPEENLKVVKDSIQVVRPNDKEIQKTTEDTLRLPFHKSYYSDISLKEFGQLLLIDSVRPMDNEITFRLMDSITSKSKETRDYYYPIFQHITNLSDGALSEVIGGYAMDYAEKYPDEFYDRYTCCDSSSKCCQQLIEIAEFIQYEIGMQQDIEAAYSSFVSAIETENHRYPEDRLTMIFIENITNGLNNYME